MNVSLRFMSVYAVKMSAVTAHCCFSSRSQMPDSSVGWRLSGFQALNRCNHVLLSLQNQEKRKKKQVYSAHAFIYPSSTTAKGAEMGDSQTGFPWWLSDVPLVDISNKERNATGWHVECPLKIRAQSWILPILWKHVREKDFKEQRYETGIWRWL